MVKRFFPTAIGSGANSEPDMTSGAARGWRRGDRDVIELLPHTPSCKKEAVLAGGTLLEAQSEPMAEPEDQPVDAPREDPPDSLPSIDEPGREVPEMDPPRPDAPHPAQDPEKASASSGTDLAP